jgi:hypothetical protein
MNSKKNNSAAVARCSAGEMLFKNLGVRQRQGLLMNNRPFLCIALFLFCADKGGFAQAKQNQERPFVDESQVAQALQQYTLVARERSDDKQTANPNCLDWKSDVCTVCGIKSAVDISVKNKTKTPVLLCRDMKPGPAKLVMSTHAEPAIAGVWEVEFGLGYRTSARAQCPHQFIASSNPPLKNAYEVGPITLEGEIPLDGMIQALVCVGLSSARVGREGEETGASLRVFNLRVVSE